MIAIAGAPGSGKSTLAERLVSSLNEAAPGCAAVLPMDGYHYDDRVLIERCLRARKGAPVVPFRRFRLAPNRPHRPERNREAEIAVPVFDRDLEISCAGARMISSAVRVLIVEGNGLLLNLHPWSSLHAMFDLTVMVDAHEELLRQRLTGRWLGYGLSTSEIEAKVEGNDLPNGRYVMSYSRTADFVLRA